MSVLKKDLIQGSVVFVLFVTEAFFHYSIGKTGKIKFVAPSRKDFFRICMVVFVFSVLSVALTKMIEYLIN